MKQVGQILRFMETDGEIVEGQIIDIINYKARLISGKPGRIYSKYLVEWFDGFDGPNPSTIGTDSQNIVD